MFKKIQLSAFTFLLTFSLSAFSKDLDTLTVHDDTILGGGKVFVMKGESHVTTDSKYGAVESGEAQIIVFENGDKRTHYSKGVNYDLEKLGMMIISDDMVISGDHILSFKSNYFEINDYLNYEKAGGTTSFHCEGGIIYKNGKSTGGSSYIHNGVVEMYCDSQGRIRARVVSVIGPGV